MRNRKGSEELDLVSTEGERMVISVVICTYNRCDSLMNTLDSLIVQECNGSFDYEIIIVDNNSNDNTKNVVELYNPKFNGRLRYIFEGNQGLSFARNRGIEEARGKVVAFTDDDVVVGKNWLKVINETFCKYDCMGMGGKVLPLGSFKLPSWMRIEGPYRIRAAITFLDPGGQTKEIKYGEFPPIGANFSFRKAAFEKYGLFNINLGRRGCNLMCYEDTEFSNRLLKNNESLMYIPESIVYHSVDESKFKKSFCRKWYFALGESSARMGTYPVNVVRYFNIPRYLFRLLIRDILKWVRALLTFKKSSIIFFYELRILLLLGEIYGNLTLRKTK